MSKNVKLIRLRFSQDEFVAEVKDQDEEFITVENPLIMAPTGPRELSVFPWAFYSSTREFRFTTEDVLYCVNPVPEIEKMYIEKTSGIALPNVQATPRIITG